MEYTYNIFEVREPRSAAVVRPFLWVLRRTETVTDYMVVGFGYRVLRDGSPVIVQDYDPAQPGFVPMTEKRARSLAEEEIRRFLEADLKEAAV